MAALDRALKILTSKRTTIISVLCSLLLYLTGADAVTFLTDTFSMTLAQATSITNLAKLALAVLAAMGYSVLHRPAAAPAPVPVGPPAE